MAIIPIKNGGGGGADSVSVTATKAQLLSGYTAITSDSNDEPIQGTIPVQGASGNVTLHTDKASQSFSAGYYDNSHGANILLEEKSVTPNSSTQNVVPSENKVLSKVVVAGDSNLIAANIANAKTIFGVVGTYRGTGEIKQAGVSRTRGSEEFTTDEVTFTMPQNGEVWYFGDCFGYYSSSVPCTGECRIYKGQSLVDNRDLNGQQSRYMASHFTANRGDVIKARVTITQGYGSLCCGFVCIY